MHVWSHPSPAVFERKQHLEQYLETVVLWEVLAGLSAESRRQPVASVADGLSALTIDYVRINADATVPNGPRSSRCHARRVQSGPGSADKMPSATVIALPRITTPSPTSSVATIPPRADSCSPTN